MFNSISNKKAVLSIFAISLTVACFYFAYIFLQVRSSRFYEVELNLPQTSQGEIAELYRQSPFKSLRIAFAPQEYFSKATFSISAAKNVQLEKIEGMTLDYLTEYYKHRKPYPTFQEQEILKIEELEKEILKQKEELTAAIVTLENLKKKYPHYQNSSFTAAEEKIVIRELEIQTLQHKLNEIVKTKSIDNLKMIAATESSRSPFSMSVFIKTFLIFVCSGLLLIAIAQKKNYLTLS